MKKQMLIYAFTFFAAIINAQQKGIAPLLSHSSDLRSSSTFAVVVGISDYQDPAIPDLRFADKDAEAFANYLRSNAGGKLDNDHLKVLINQQATMAQFANVLDWLIENAKEGDQAIIYFSGHGDVEKKTLTQPGFLLCWDAPAKVYMAGGAFNLRDIQEIVSTLSIQNKAKVIVITDACRSGKLAGSSVGGSQATAANLAKQYANEIKIMSCQPNEYSIEGEQWGGGRGAFSFHLLDALYGLADNNSDQWVTLQEIGRYLEDHVSNEVAPVSQVPMIIGNRNERMSNVDANLLASIKSGKTNQVALLTSIEARGIEDEVLKNLDSSIFNIYQLFKSALKEKTFLEPKNSCADSYFEQLIKEPKLERLHSTMRRNYAAALQDDAQQVINVWLKSDIQQMECIRKTLRSFLISKYLNRAAELLGENHYMYKTLKSRQYLFEGKALNEKIRLRYDTTIGKQVISMYQKSLFYEPNSPNTYQLMSRTYGNNLLNADSAYDYAMKANQLSPNWILPFTDLSYILVSSFNNKMELAKQLLDKAMEIDSTHGYLWSQLGTYYIKKKQFDKALYCFNKYESSDGAKFPCWYNEVGQYYYKTKKYKEAETYYKKALDMDSTRDGIWVNLGVIYYNTKEYEKAERCYLKAISMDSLDYITWGNLGNLYKKMNRFEEAEKSQLKSISLNSTDFNSFYNLGNLYKLMDRFPESEKCYLRAIELDSSEKVVWNNLGDLYEIMDRNEDAINSFMKVVSKDSMDKSGWGNLGIVYVKTKNYKFAEQALLKALSIDSTYAYARNSLGVLYFETDRYNLAGIEFDKVKVLSPDKYDAYLGFAYLSLFNNQLNEAFRNVEEAIKRKINYKLLLKDKHLEKLLSLPEWEVLMKKYFPDRTKN